MVSCIFSTDQYIAVLQAKFEMIPSEGGTSVIECAGIGLVNKHIS